MQNHIIFSRNKQVQSGWDGRFGTFTFYLFNSDCKIISTGGNWRGNGGMIGFMPKGDELRGTKACPVDVDEIVCCWGESFGVRKLARYCCCWRASPTAALNADATGDIWEGMWKNGCIIDEGGGGKMPIFGAVNGNPECRAIPRAAFTVVANEEFGTANDWNRFRLAFGRRLIFPVLGAIEISDFDSWSSIQ